MKTIDFRLDIQQKQAFDTTLKSTALVFSRHIQKKKIFNNSFEIQNIHARLDIQQKQAFNTTFEM